MKSRIFTFLAAMLLTSICAFAQSNQTLKGDVNEDGIVDVADISSIIDIMASGEVTLKTPTYYWYVGVIKPTDPTNSEQNSGLNKWTSLGTTLPTSSIEVGTSDPTYANHTWYIAAPADAGYRMFNYSGSLNNESAFDISTFYVGNVEYILWTSRFQGDICAYSLRYEGNTKYYWYVGLKKPDTSTNPILDLALRDYTSGWHKIWKPLEEYNASNMLYNGVTSSININWEDTTYYLALPIGINIYNGSGNNITSSFTLESSNVKIAGELYNVYSGYASKFNYNLY